MKTKVNKTFLDTLLDDTQQNALSSLYALEPTRSGINQRTIYEEQNVNDDITGTDEDDTLHITGNLTADNAKHSTYIDLQEGNNIVNIDGKISSHDGSSINIAGFGSHNTITVSGIEAFATKYTNLIHSSVEFDLQGSETNSLHVTGDIFSYSTLYHYGPAVSVYLFSLDAQKLSNNYATFDGNIYYNNTDSSDLFFYGYENQCTIKGNFILDNSDECFSEMSGIYNDFTIGGSLSLKDSRFEIQMLSVSDNPETSYSTFRISDQLHVSGQGQCEIRANEGITDIDIGSIFAQGPESVVEVSTSGYNTDVTVSSTKTINGNIEANNGSKITFEHYYGVQVLEVKGKVITQSDNDANSSPNNHNDYSNITFHALESSSDTYNFLGGISNNNGHIELETDSGKDQINITSDVSVQNTLHDDKALNTFDLGDGDDSFTLVGNLFAGAHGLNSILAGEGNDIISIKGNVSVKDDGRNELSGGAGDDTFILNGHIDAGALAISGDDGNDTLVLTANSNNNFEVNYKDWLTDFSSTNSLVHSNIENIRLDVDRLQIGKLGWFTDIINKANADGAHITVTDKIGHQVVNPTTYLAQGNDTHNPINDVLDHYAPATANAAQPKAFAEHVAAPSTDAFTAPHFDNNNFLHEMEQQAQVHAAAVA